MYANKQGHKDVVELLLKHAKQGKNIQIPNNMTLLEGCLSQISVEKPVSFNFSAKLSKYDFNFETWGLCDFSEQIRDLLMNFKQRSCALHVLLKRGLLQNIEMLEIKNKIDSYTTFSNLYY